MKLPSQNKIKPLDAAIAIVNIFDSGMYYFYSKNYKDAIKEFNSLIKISEYSKLFMLDDIWINEPIHLQCEFIRTISNDSLRFRAKFIKGIACAKENRFEEFWKDYNYLNGGEVEYPFEYIHLMRGFYFDQEGLLPKSLDSIKSSISYDHEVLEKERFLLDHLSFGVKNILIGCLKLSNKDSKIKFISDAISENI